MSESVNPTSDGLKAVEAAALALLEAVRSAGGGRFLSAANGSREVTAGPRLVDLANEFLLSKYRAGRSDNYTGLLIKELKSFVTGREKRPAASISSAEIETWLHAQQWSGRTMQGRLLTLRNLFSWAVSRGEMISNPALGVDMPTDQSQFEPPGIHSPDQARIVLETARRLDKNAMRCLAIRYFAGLRTSEAISLEETEIRAEHIEITAAKAKTRRRRLVTILPVLRAWLELGGTLPLKQANNRLRAISRAAPVPWPHNATRHSFVSYHLAKYQNAGKTALEAGHSEQMLFNHYREIVTPAAAGEFFNLFPK